MFCVLYTVHQHLKESFMQSNRYITLKCGTVLRLLDMEAAGLSYVPCGQVNGEDQPLLKFAHLWGHRTHVTRQTYGKKWFGYPMRNMTGVQLMTGFPTFKRSGKLGYLYYTSLDIEARMIENHPDAVAKIRNLYQENVSGGYPCILSTKSDGLRLDAYTEYVGKKMSFKDDEKKMLFEILADKCLARIDHRYAMVSGSLLDIPTLSKSILQEIYYIIAEISTHEQSDSKPREVVESSQLGDLNIQWDADNRSQLFSTEHCQRTSHTSNRHEVRFTKHPDGSIDGKCFNCGETWWEIQPKKHRQRTPQNSLPKYIPSIEPITALPHDHPSIANAPPVEVRETPSFRHFSEEERIVVKETLGISPDAGWKGATPIWTPKYEYLHPLTSKFALNGQPSEVEKRRVFSTLFGSCDICGGITAKWIDRYLLTAGFYCDGCHTDYPLGSYLELELNRKLPNSIISDHHGFLGENPDFLDFRLFQPGILTHLGAGMGTGKTTEIVKVLVSLAEQGLGRGIIAVPRVALAQQLAYQLRWQHGHEAWGLYTEGTTKGNKFLGKHGAIVCLPSLQQAVAEAEEMGIQQIYVAIDELDFSYELLSLNIAQATGVKKVLRDALNTTGLVVAGQTESTLALEAFAKEVECEEVQAFYNTAVPADGRVVIKEHAADTNINALLASGIDDIADHLRNGQNVYSFCASRRDGEVLAEEFSAENPVLYNAYTRGETRAHELLRYQRLTDSNLFIGTSAAGVGISFLDKKAVTIIIGGLIFGSRHANMAVQKAIRDRGRRGVLMHYKSYNLSLPMRPTENRDVSLYHETLKAVLNTTADINLPAHAVTKLAAAQALASLADVQFSAFLKYHLNVVGNMEVVENTPMTPPKDVTEAIRIRRTEIRNIENELKIENAKRILNSLLDADTETQLLTSSEIRKFRNQGRFLTDEALANKLANEAARAVGWDDAVDRFEAGDPFKEFFTDADIDVALALVERNFDFEAFNKKRAGYLAVNAPKWTEHRFETDVQNADRQLTLDGLGIEITAVKDYRFLGELLKSLLDRLVGTVFEEDTLATTVRGVLNTKAKSGKTFRQELRSGALGTSEYRKARFLHCVEDEKLIVDWVARFISEWYPARLAKREDFYALQPDTHAELYLKAFGRWLHHQPDVFDGAAIQLDIFEPIEMPEANAAQKEIARGMRTAGATLKAIAEELGTTPKTVSLWCEGIKPKRKAKQTRAERQQTRKSSKQLNARKKQERIDEAYRLYTQEKLSYEDIAIRMGVKSHTTISRWLKQFDF